MWQREKQAHSTCNSVCEGTSTHLYDNFLFTMSKDSNTDTIHFPFINWCRNVARRRSDSQSPLGLKGDIVCLTGGGRELLVAEGMFGEPCIYNNVYLMLGFCEHLEPSAWHLGQGLPVPTIHLPYLRLNNCSWSSSSTSCYSISFFCSSEFHVWHLESSPVTQTDIQFTRIDGMQPGLQFFTWCQGSFYFPSPRLLFHAALIMLIISKYQVDNFNSN